MKRGFAYFLTIAELLSIVSLLLAGCTDSAGSGGQLPQQNAPGYERPFPINKGEPPQGGK